MTHVRIACLQSRAYDSVRKAEEVHAQLIRSAAAKGAQFVCTQELFQYPYFCQTQDVAVFDLADPLPSPALQRFATLAAELRVVLILSFFEQDMPGVYYNTAVVVDADGSILGRYRKSHIPQDPGFEEKFYFTPGDSGFQTFDTTYGRIGVLICWDQWFPEAARQTALAGAEIIFCPTAIGWLSDEKEREGERQLRMWRKVQEGHAIANGCFWAATNRVGIEGNIEFWGSSFIADVNGDPLATASTDREEILLADCDLDALKTHRTVWPFFRDRRPEVYRRAAVSAEKPCPSAVPRRPPSAHS